MPLLALTTDCRKAVPPGARSPAGPPGPGARTITPAHPRRRWAALRPLAPGQTYVLGGTLPRPATRAEAQAQGLLDVDLSDDWAPFLFSESDGAGSEVKPNAYRKTFVALANDRASPDELLMQTPQGELAALSAAGLALDKGAAESREGKRAIAEARRAVHVQHDRNYLEAYGIPPSLSVLLARIGDDEHKTCYDKVDVDGLSGFAGTVTFQSREQSKREYAEAISDAAWVERMVAADKSGADATTGEIQTALTRGDAKQAAVRDAALARLAGADKRVAARIGRYRRGQARLRAIRALQARLVCEGLLSPRTKHTLGLFDLATNQALAAWERKNDIFGWGFLGGETQAALLRPRMALHFDTFRRILMERIADGAGIVEDGSVSAGERPVSYRDAGGGEREVPDLLGEYADALRVALHVRTPADVARFLRRVGPKGLATLHVAFRPPPLPPYYGERMDLSVEIDRGDVWYDFPFEPDGTPVNQPRARFPTLTLFVHWHKQKIPLVRWRTTIGSWRSETNPDGKVYYKYKNSDVGPRIWKDIVAGPVWIPPDGTPVQDLLTRKTLDRDLGPVTVVNTDLMGPGFQSAYGLVMAIHLRQAGGVLSDNQIRTHGSVDYTSIARRFSHGCHRLVNSRAVHLFDFILRRRSFVRLGNQPINVRRRFSYEDRDYEYRLDTRGYDYQLDPPVPVLVSEGHILGKAKHPIEAYVPKPGVDYGDEAGSPDGEMDPGGSEVSP